MFQATLAFYGLPANWTHAFKRILLTDRETGAPILDEKTGKQKTSLRSCNAPKESVNGNSVWLQVNEPFEDTATFTSQHGTTYPKKAGNHEIHFIRNVTLDTEYPPDPHIAITIGRKLVDYLITMGFFEAGHPIEHSGAGPHIVIPIIPIETTKETARLWNEAVAKAVKTHIKPEFERLCKEAGIEMDLGGFDISRVLSPPGTWRPRNPEKADCEALHQGVLRQWLEPYTDGNYPIRKESAKLTQLIRDTFDQISNPTQWVFDYAATHPNSDRSALFQTLVNVTYLKFGEDAVKETKDLINSLSGEKYNGRLDEELERSLKLAMQTSKQDTSSPKEKAASKSGKSRHEIITNNTQLRDITCLATDALRESNTASERMYVHFSQLSRVVKDEDGRPIVQQMNTASLKGELSNAADFYRTRKLSQGELELISVSPPNEVAEQILALPPADWRFPSLKGVTEVPLVKPDGTLLDTPGYDRKLKVFYDPSDDLKGLEIPEYCTQEDAINAAKVLRHLIAEFPFEGDADHANMIGLLITPFIRHAFKGDIQLALLDATNPGTGKTFLAQIAAIIATGARTEARSQKGDDDEWRKFILAVLLKCPQIVLIDNVRGTLASVSLEAALTSETISDRLLGVSKDVSATNTAVWVATGNNLLIGGDLARRCFRIRLIANNANPDERDDYAIPEILDYCEAHRRELVTAILIMIKAWFQAARPPAKAKIAKADSFGNWIKMVGGVLEFADIHGWQQNREELRSKNNEEAKEWERFLSTWSLCYGDVWKKTLDVQNDIISGSPHSSIANGDSRLFETLPTFLAEKFAKNRDSFYLSLGRALSFRKQTVYGLQGLQIESKEDSHAGGMLWRVTSKNGPENEPPQTPPEPKTQNDSTSGSSEYDKTSADDCRGFNPLGYRENFQNPTSKTSKRVPYTADDAATNVFTGAQGFQTSANISSPQNGYMPKVSSDGSISAVEPLCEQPPESAVCGGSFSTSEFGDDLLAEYQALYQQVGQARTQIAPLSTIMWYVPDSGFETGQVTVKEYSQRLNEMYMSRDRRKILAGLEEMKRKLGGVN
jgi:hypothetical protein